MGFPLNYMEMTRMIRSTLIGLVVATGLIRPALAEEVKLGYVDLRRALHETEDGHKAESSLKKVFDQKQKELDEQQDDVKKAIEDLNKKRTLLPADTVRQKEAELQERVAKVQQTYLRHQQDLAAKEEEATRPIVDRLQRIIAKIAGMENFTMILDKNQGVVFAKPHLDLTNEVIRRYNAGEEKGAAPAPKEGKPAPSKKK
jgi:outer membrane protein